MSSEHYHKHSQQNCNHRTFNGLSFEGQQHQTRNGMKRPRGYSPPASDHANDPSYSHQMTKRLRRSSCTNSLGTRNHNPNDFNHQNGMFLTNKSDDDISLAEEAQITPTSLPQHSSFMQQKQNEISHHSAQIHQQQQRLQRGISNVAAKHVPSDSIFSGTKVTTYATDYQPMNSFLGNLHLMRQQQQLKRQPSSYTLQGKKQIRDHPVMVRTQQQQQHQQQQQQQQQQPQNHYHRHYGNYHLVPTKALNTKTRSQKKSVSLRVNSNLY